MNSLALAPRNLRILFVASVVMVTLSVILSVFNAATVLSAPQASAVTVPNVVGFEGFLADQNGDPISDGTYSLTFRIYNVASGGSALWTEQQTSVDVVRGLYAVTLGSVTTLPGTIFDGNRWIGVTVGAGAEMAPRTRIASVPFSLNADNANKVAGASLQGMIAAFESGCPSGWSEVTEIRGRTIVGVPSDGTAGGTVGTPMANLENRTHAHLGPSHTHDLATNGTTTNMTGEGQFEYVWRRGDAADGRLVAMGSSGSQSRAIVTARTTSAGNALTSTAATGDVIPYIQLYYCRFNP